MLALVLAALALPAISHAIQVPSQTAPPAVSSTGGYTVLQMNLCLSGQADCYGGTDYPSVVTEAAAQVVAQEPSVVTLNEACSADAAEIARQTGYRWRFAAVRYRGAPIACVNPGGRGVFGLAVLTSDAISSSGGAAFEAQADDDEERRWLCVTTVGRVRVCTAHLSTRNSAQQRAANDAECSELRDVLHRRDQDRATVFGGDVNRHAGCAPRAMWTSRDDAADQHPGIQHIYSSRAFNGSSPLVTASDYTDHDFLLAGVSLAMYVEPASTLQ